jgi:hypothetical protein
MLIFSTLFLLVITSSLITAAPNIKPLPSPIPSSPSPAGLQPSGIQNPPPSPSPTPVKQCLPKWKKQCCVTVQDSTEQLTSNLGEVIPFLAGVKIGSVIGTGCMFFSIKSYRQLSFLRSYISLIAECIREGDTNGPSHYNYRSRHARRPPG